MVACGVRSQARCPCHFAWALGRNPVGIGGELVRMTRPGGCCYGGLWGGVTGKMPVPLCLGFGAQSRWDWGAGADDKAGRVLLWWLVG